MAKNESGKGNSASSGKPRSTSGRKSEDDGNDKSDGGTKNVAERGGEERSNASNDKPTAPTRSKRPFWKRNKPAVEKGSSKVDSAKERDPGGSKSKYTGRFTGGTATRRSISHNIDCSQFPVLTKTVYEVLKKVDTLIEEKCPYPIFQHYCVTILNAYLFDYAAKTQNFTPFSEALPLLEQIGAEKLHLPNVLSDYISSIGSTISPSDDVVAVNIPLGARPLGTRAAHQPPTRSGTFGICNNVRHNLYECYISPYVTSEYIISTLQTNNDDDEVVPEWQPLPPPYRPENGIPNENLLGYWPREAVPPKGITELARCQFENNGTSLGRLAYSKNVMEITNITLTGLRDKIELQTCDFKFREIGSLFVFKGDETNQIMVPPADRLVSENAHMYSPFVFGTSAANRANYFGYKRKRSMMAIGPCYTIHGEVPNGWAITRNNNFDQVGEAFGVHGQLETRASLRADIYYEACTSGTLENDLSEWIESQTIK